MERTPGCWKVGNYSFVVVTDDQTHADFLKRNSPGSVEHYGGSLVCESCQPEDAKIIAAAPDLLDACMQMKAALETKDLIEYGNAVVSITNAINKAVL